ncbi:ArsR/SmtB family transcription factor, partial [Streptomyces sp. NPDC059612]|uniref:ArsR/SmtB family transcription factor n=1 Tax=Streptomyces sp. NPDC059612 TaxID=3346885 RepID=UPI0036C5D5CB
MSTPLYRLKAEFFKTLGHPVRIRVLELLSEREHAVSEMLAVMGVEAAHLSQQLAVLRRAGLVVARREGSAVYYTLAAPEVAELLRVARTILTEVLTGQAELLADLRAADPRGEGPARSWCASSTTPSPGRPSTRGGRSVRRAPRSR